MEWERRAITSEASVTQLRADHREQVKGAKRDVAEIAARYCRIRIQESRV